MRRIRSFILDCLKTVQRKFADAFSESQLLQCDQGCGFFAVFWHTPLLNDQES